ncbi:MAG: serine/threonine protein phosphatase [Lachnospiraceae bacterium]|nr:serine/threonine protein phosphatase [Lachnospiraceae bacterium]
MHYAVSDIHGCFDELMRLMEKIGFSDEDTLYVIGDTIDRGPKPVEVLTWMMGRHNVIPIIGNHEYMMMRVLLPGLKKVDSEEEIEKTLTYDFLVDSNLWFLSDNGGRITAEAFRSLPEYRREALLDYVKEFSVYEDIVVNDRHFVMVHTINEDIHSLSDLENADIYDLGAFLISRPDFDGVWDQEEIFVIGHTPTWFLDCKDNMVFRNGNLINIDCGCVMGGHLAALCLETMEVFYE